MDPTWVLVAIVFELASCMSFVVCRLLVDRIARAPAPARALAWTSMAGGAGGLAALVAGQHRLGPERGSRSGRRVERPRPPL